MTEKYVFPKEDWTLEDIEQIWQVIDKAGKEVFGLDYYEPSIEIITSDQMIDACSTHAMPMTYNHWSFGKNYMATKRNYEKGLTGLAYEVVINTDPCIAYLMENNSATMQALVLCHAACGHSSFFKCNYLFQNWTDASFILDYLKFARSYVKECEYKYGEKEVETILDCCHSLELYGVDKYQRPPALKKELHEHRKKAWHKYEEQTFNDLWRTVPRKKAKKRRTVAKLAPKRDRGLPEENILYFIEKHSPILEDWQRELVRIVRKVAQYFYPQRQTKLMNEGWASFIHFEMMTHLHDEGHLTDGAYLEFLHNHSNVLCQPAMTAINPYKLGYNIFNDIKRICQNPTEEDRRWFPELIGRDWLEATKEAMMTHKDESFILQYLSPKVMRDMKLFTLYDHECNDYYKVVATHRDEDLRSIREDLAITYLTEQYVPPIEVTGVDWDDSRELFLMYNTNKRQHLKGEDARKVLENVKTLWGFPATVDFK